MLATHGVKLGERTETGASAKEDWMAIDGDHVVAGDPQGQATFETHQTPSSAVASPYLVCWAPPAHVFCQDFPIRHIHRLAVALLACDKKERDPSSQVVSFGSLPFLPLSRSCLSCYSPILVGICTCSIPTAAEPPAIPKLSTDESAPHGIRKIQHSRGPRRRLSRPPYTGGLDFHPHWVSPMFTEAQQHGTAQHRFMHQIPEDSERSRAETPASEGNQL